MRRGITMMVYLYYWKIRNINVVTRFRLLVTEDPDKVMLVNCQTGQEWTYKQVNVLLYKSEACI